MIVLMEEWDLLDSLLVGSAGGRESCSAERWLCIVAVKSPEIFGGGSRVLLELRVTVSMFWMTVCSDINKWV
jgi:hypothetical protein